MFNRSSKNCARFLAMVCALLLLANFNFVAFAENRRETASLRLLDNVSYSNFKRSSSGCLAQKKAKGSGQTRSLVGNDGDYTVTTAGTVLNNYAILAADAAAGATNIQVTNTGDLDSSITQLGALAAGDLLMIIQMRGATIDTSNSISYGSVTAINSAGLYEFVTVSSVTTATNTINLDTTNGCGALRNNYSATGRTQVIRVPQFNNLTINSGASVTANAWDGQRGGVVALQTAATLTINGTISVDAAGFRGGALDNNANGNVPDYVGNDPANGAEKGEGIAGDATIYDSLGGRYYRGAPANGGGGGNSHNAGGGGGANGDNNHSWTGQGVMSSSVTGAGAWTLDPGYIANGNSLTDSSGGGRGGYTYSGNNADAITTGPGQSAWGGDSRSEHGGLGGRPVTNNPANRLFMGGGGGAGDANNSAGGAGGNGGGLAFVFGNAITGTGSISANGQNGNNTVGGGNDAPGGAGAGGTIIASATSLNGISISANGGNGGNQFINSNEAEGPGGGGGGGYIATEGGTVTQTAAGGQSGITTSASLSEFPVNGGTNGAAGVTNASIVSFPICNSVATSATVIVSGRVMTNQGRGINKAVLTLADSLGNVRYAMTNPFGYYNFTDVTAGQAYILTVSAKRYRFDYPSRVLSASENSGDLNFVAQP